MTERSRNNKPYRQASIPNTIIATVILILSALSILSYTPLAVLLTKTKPKHHQLDENSVVLITGAAGFLGYHISLSLHHTYYVYKIISINTLSADDLDLASLLSSHHNSTKESDSKGDSPYWNSLHLKIKNEPEPHGRKNENSPRLSSSGSVSSTPYRP